MNKIWLVTLALLVLGLALGFWIGPLLAALWFRLNPKLEYGFMMYLHQYGSSRWLAMLALACQWRLLFPKVALPRGFWQWMGKVGLWLFSSLVLTEALLGLIFALDVRVWYAVDTWPPFDATEHSMFLMTTYGIPVDTLLSAARVALQGNPAGHLFLQFDVTQGASEIWEISMEQWIASLLWLGIAAAACVLLVRLAFQCVWGKHALPHRGLAAARQSAVLLLFAAYYFSQAEVSETGLWLLPVTAHDILVMVPVLLAFSFLLAWFYKWLARTSESLVGRTAVSTA